MQHTPERSAFGGVSVVWVVESVPPVLDRAAEDLGLHDLDHVVLNHHAVAEHVRDAQHGLLGGVGCCRLDQRAVREADDVSLGATDTSRHLHCTELHPGSHASHVGPDRPVAGLQPVSKGEVVTVLTAELGLELVEALRRQAVPLHPHVAQSRWLCRLPMHVSETDRVAPSHGDDGAFERATHARLGDHVGHDPFVQNVFPESSDDLSSTVVRQAVGSRIWIVVYTLLTVSEQVEKDGLFHGLSLGTVACNMRSNAYL